MGYNCLWNQYVRFPILSAVQDASWTPEEEESGLLLGLTFRNKYININKLKKNWNTQIYAKPLFYK